jgi:WD40 repeat protein
MHKVTPDARITSIKELHLMTYPGLLLACLVLAGCSHATSQPSATNDPGRRVTTAPYRPPPRDPEVDITAAAFTPDSKFLLLAYTIQRFHPHRQTEFVLSLWAVGTGREVRRFSADTRHTQTIGILPDGKTALTAGEGRLNLWDLGTGELIRTWRAEANPLACLAISRNGKQALSGGKDGTLELWELPSGNRLRMLSAGQGTVLAVKLTPDGKAAFSGTQDRFGDTRGRKVQAWNLAIGTDIAPPKPKTAWRQPLAFSPDGTLAISDDWDGNPKEKPYLVLWELLTGSDVRAFNPRPGEVTVPPGRGDALAAAFTPDGKRVLTGDSDGTLRVWDAKTGAQIRAHDIKQWPIIFLLSPDRQLAFTVSKPALSKSPSLTFWDVNSGTLIRHLTLSENP